MNAHLASERILNSRVEAIRHIMATMFSAQNALRSLAPEFLWSGLGNLLGDYGEFVAINHYGLKKEGNSSAGYDAINGEGRTVQIHGYFEQAKSERIKGITPLSINNPRL